MPYRPLLLSSILCAAFFLPTAAAPQTENGELVRMRVEVEYLPDFPATGDGPGDLYVYLDGDLLAWVPTGGQFAPTPPAVFERGVPPGAHVLRLLQEKHLARSAGGWSHQARAAPFELFFQLAAGGRGELTLRLIESSAVFATNPTPVSAMITQNGKTVQNLEKKGPGLDKWPALCEEIEANLDPGRKKIPKKARADLEHCVRWADLWRSLDGGVPARDEARAVLERYDFKPRFYRRFE